MKTRSDIGSKRDLSFWNKHRALKDKKYRKALNLKLKIPQLCLTDICRKFNVNPISFRSHLKRRNIKIPNCMDRKEKHLKFPIKERWKWPTCKVERINYLKNPKVRENAYATNRRNGKKYRKNLADSYVARLLHTKRVMGKTKRIIFDKIPNSLIEAKRIQLKLKRKCYEQN